MPENQPHLLERVRSDLRLKLSVIIILLTLTATMLASIINFNLIYWPLLPIPILCSAIGIVLIWYLLKPIEKIYSAAQLYAKGEFNHQIDIKSGDELELISTEFNQMANNLSSHLSSLSEDKSATTYQNNRLNSIISTISDGILVLDIHCQVVLSNQAAEQMSGYSSSQMLGKPINQLIIFMGKDGLAIPISEYCPINLVPGENKIPYKSDQTITLIGNNKKEHPVKISSSAISSDSHSDLGCIILLHDQSKEKELEAIQLDFVSMASHELRTPLTSIIGYLSVFMNENKDKLSSEQFEQLNRVSASGQQLKAIIENLLSVSKVERGAFSMNTASIDWNKLIDKVVTDNQIQAASKNITLTLDAEANLPKIGVDEVRITEVLNNLIGNAINYTNEGGKITVVSKKEGNEIVTSITDTGVGIPADAIPHLFTKFFRVSGALDKSSNSKGTGLGLYISKSIIDLHHGRIWVNSEVNKGSTFSFALPLT